MSDAAEHDVGQDEGYGPLEMVRNAGAQNSIFDALKARLAASQEATLDVPIAAYDGLVIARYRKPENHALKAIEQQTMRARRAGDPEAEISGASEFVAACLIELRMPNPEAKPDDTDPTLPIVPGRVCRFDAWLIEQMGGPSGLNPRQAVRYFFGGDQGGAAILTHFGKISEWAGGTDLETQTRVAGESKATPS